MNTHLNDIPRRIAGQRKLKEAYTAWPRKPMAVMSPQNLTAEIRQARRDFKDSCNLIFEADTEALKRNAKPVEISAVRVQAHLCALILRCNAVVPAAKRTLKFQVGSAKRSELHTATQHEPKRTRTGKVSVAHQPHSGPRNSKWTDSKRSVKPQLLGRLGLGHSTANNENTLDASSWRDSATTWSLDFTFVSTEHLLRDCSAVDFVEGYARVLSATPKDACLQLICKRWPERSELRPNRAGNSGRAVEGLDQR